jgi:tellurite resistance protein
MNDTNASRLSNFPVAWFAVIMGLAGLTLAWARTERTFALDVAVSPWLLGVSIAVFVILALIYSAKALRYREAVTAELVHPVKQAFVPTFSIALILLGIATYATAPGASQWLWAAGTLLHLILTLYVLFSWMHHGKYEIGHLNPAWFIPVVGNILVPIAGVHHASPELSWFFFSVGLFFWPVLTAILFYRLIFHASLPERLMPTLFIFIAPPTVGFIAYHQLTHELDVFARILYHVGLFFTLLLFTQLRQFARLKFFLSWWAYSFPLAAITLATLIMAEVTGIGFYYRLATVLLAILTLVVAGLAVRTLVAVARREICVEGH